MKRHFGWGSRRPKVAQPGQMCVRHPAPDINWELRDQRAKEIVGASSVPPQWIDAIRSIEPGEALELIGKILASRFDRIDGVVVDAETHAIDTSVHFAVIPEGDKLTRIAIVLACLAPPAAGKMWDANSEGVLFEAYNRIQLSYLHNRNPAREFDT